jgi:diguanylate cyclase (GGDEF)-like protein
VIILEEIENYREVIPRLQKAASYQLNVKNTVIEVTPSIGVAFFPEHGQDSESLLKQADDAMYLAKESGKNQYKFLSDRFSK